MGIFKKTVDPISDRARALNAEIAALESQIKKLNSASQAGEGPRMRSTAFPHGPTVKIHTPTAEQPPHHSREPIFESVDQAPIKSQTDPSPTASHFNERGVLKFDFTALVERIKKQFRGPTISNPKLVNYLAAGSVQGLRPLRIEKRIGRTRFITVTCILILVLLGIIAGLKH